jgi:hypothetical protein
MSDAPFSARRLTLRHNQSTVKLTVALCDDLPLRPTIVNVYVFIRILERVVIVRVDEPEPVREDGLNVAPATREGKPFVLRVTVPPEPSVEVTLTI